MIEKTLYLSNDGFVFTTPELCLEYEKKRDRWTAAMKEIHAPEGSSLDLSKWIPLSPYRADTIEPEGKPRGFLEQLAYLQRLATFMAEE